MDTSGNRQDIILKISEEEERIIQRKNKKLAEKEKETREEIHRLSEQTKNTPFQKNTEKNMGRSMGDPGYGRTSRNSDNHLCPGSLIRIHWVRGPDRCMACFSSEKPLYPKVMKILILKKIKSIQWHPEGV